jgi:hypothetical protein
MNQNQAASLTAWVTFAFFAAAGVTVWLIPVIVAMVRGMPNKWGIFWLDLFLGWTGVGWVVALVMASGAKPQRWEFRPGEQIRNDIPPQWQPPANGTAGGRPSPTA